MQQAVLVALEVAKPQVEVHAAGAVRDVSERAAIRGNSRELVPVTGLARERPQAVEPRHGRGRGVIQVDQIELVPLVSALVDRQHRPAGAGDIVGARDRLGQRRQLGQIA